MSMSDPLGDMLARIRNALAVNKETVECLGSKFSAAVLQVMTDEGYITGYKFSEDERKLQVVLKYYGGKPVIENIKRVSKPGLRRYAASDSIKPVLNGMGIAIVSTSKGVMTDTDAKKQGVGGEVVCHVS